MADNNNKTEDNPIKKIFDRQRKTNRELYDMMEVCLSQINFLCGRLYHNGLMSHDEYERLNKSTKDNLEKLK